MTVVAGAVFLGVLLSVWSAANVRAGESNAIGLEFQRLAQQHCAALERELQLNLTVVRSVADFVHTSPGLDLDRFDAFARPALERSASIRAVEWVPRVSAAQRFAFEQAARRDGFADYRLWRREEGDAAPSPQSWR